MVADLLKEDVLVSRLRQVAQACGASVNSQQPTKIANTACPVNLVVEKNGRRIVGQAAPLCRRFDSDVANAVALGAQLLLIVTPDSLMAQRCRRQLRRYTPFSAKIKVIACPLGAALQILRQALDASHSPPAPSPPHPRPQP